HGTVGAVGPVACAGAPKVCTAQVTFTPDADYNGPAGFAYTASDGSLQSNPATVSVTVDPVNDAPVSNDGTRTTAEDTPLALNLAALVDDVETSDADLSYEIVSGPAHGTATATTYTPDANFNGTDSLTYKVTDRGDPDDCGAPGPGCAGPKTSAIATVTITVTAVNDPPIAADRSASTAEDTAVTVTLSATDPEDDDVTQFNTSAANHGTVGAVGPVTCAGAPKVCIADVSFTPEADYNGPAGFTYTASDGSL